MTSETIQSAQVSQRGSLVGPALFVGFLSAILTWCAWFVTHLPWVGMAEQTATSILLAVWFVGIAWSVGRLPKRMSLIVGTLGGGISSLLGLLILGSKLAASTDASQVSSGVMPAAPVVALGFLLLGLFMGLFGGLVGRLIARDDTPALSLRDWLGRFAVVALCAVAPLLFIGGLVTSTQSGMAVPDWPNTFGANMFLYPLGSHSQAGVYLEHAHRLFGALIGLTTLSLLVFTACVERRRWVVVLAMVVFGLVCVQGLLGGLRVIENKQLLAMFHGVLAQLTFGTLAALAVVLSAHFRSLGTIALNLDPTVARRIKVLGTAAAHMLIIQLIMGAWYRHFRSPHPLYTHILLSIFVLLLVVLVGFLLASPSARASSVGKRLGPLGLAMVGVVVLQFTLGWLTFFVGGGDMQAATVWQALVRTAHQANGALLIASVAAAYTWGMALKRAQKPVGSDPNALAAA